MYYIKIYKFQQTLYLTITLSNYKYNNYVHRRPTRINIYLNRLSNRFNLIFFIFLFLYPNKKIKLLNILCYYV